MAVAKGVRLERPIYCDSSSSHMYMDGYRPDLVMPGFEKGCISYRMNCDFC